MEKTIYTINFSDKDIAITGKDLDSEKAVARTQTEARFLSQGKEISKDQLDEMIKMNIPSKRDAEKSILINLLTVAAKEATLSKFNKLTDLAETIENSDDKVDVDDEDIKIFRETFDKVKPDQRPDGWRFCRELFKQLEHPEIKE